MELVDLAVRDAEGTLLAHAQDGLLDGHQKRIKKGTLLCADDLAALSANGHRTIMVACLAENDVHEDAAAERLASAVCGDHIRVERPFTGRANLFAEKAGLFLPNADLIHAINRVDPSITIATLPPYRVAEAGRMVATVKIIPFAVPEPSLFTCLEIANKSALSVAEFHRAKVALVATRLPTLKTNVMDKTRKVLDNRLEIRGSEIIQELRPTHDISSVRDTIKQLAVEKPDLILLFGASAMIDAEDVLPKALCMAGGTVSYVGMPVDPGNLLFLGEMNGVPVIGAPGCARSPVENGFDWILNRVLAKQTIAVADIAAMGVGGLLMEIVSRPQPRELPVIDIEEKPNITALVLAAGQSTRMGANNKLIAELNGKALVRHVAEAASNSNVRDVTIVTGAESQKVESALASVEKEIVFNPDFDQGLSTSLRVGLRHIASLEAPADGVIILLGDMPKISADIIDRLIAAFDPANGKEIIVPTDMGKRGNPVLWSSRFFHALSEVQGDTGGRHLIGEFAEFVQEVEIGDPASFDLDTPDALKDAGGSFAD